jgi:type I protein arginine methyltransferase
MSVALSEHIEYLTLPGRNALYREAIARVLQPGDKVADLGCGVGVLGMFCLEAGAAHCWGIDSSEAIYLARDTMQRAGMGDRYTCIAGSTFTSDLPEKVDLIICDHVGFFGFDYGIIRLMRDARQRFLKPSGQMVPRSLDLMIAAASSHQCLSKAAAWGREFVPPQYHWLEELGRNVRYNYGYTADELLSSESRLGHISFADDEPELFRFEAVLTITKAGRFDGVAGWFDCELAEGVRMNNSPLDPASIKRGQAFLPARESFEVEVGDEVRVALRFRADDHMIAWTITPPGGAAPHRMSTFNSTVFTPADLVKDTGRALSLSPMGEARAFVLAHVDGARSSEDIAAILLAERPDLFPTEQALRDFVKSVLTRDCSV